MTRPSKKQRAFLAVYQPVHDDFARFCRARTFGQFDHEDLMHETLLVAYRKFETIRSKKAFLSFLCGISIRILSNHKQKMREVQASENQLDFTLSHEQPTDSRAEVHFLYRTLAQLPEEQRECLILFEISGFAIKEIAALQDVSESAVKKRLERGRNALRQLLGQQPTHQTGKEVSNG